MRCMDTAIWDTGYKVFSCRSWPEAWVGPQRKQSNTSIYRRGEVTYPKTFGSLGTELSPTLLFQSNTAHLSYKEVIESHFWGIPCTPTVTFNIEIWLEFASLWNERLNNWVEFCTVTVIVQGLSTQGSPNRCIFMLGSWYCPPHSPSHNLGPSPLCMSSA